MADIATGKFNAKNVKLYIGGVVLEEEQGFTINVNTDFIDVTSKDNNAWGDYLVGRKDWTADVTIWIDHGATEGIDEIFGYINNDTSITIEATSDTTGNPEWQGTGVVGNLSMEYQNNEGASASFTIQGRGPLVLGVKSA